MNLRVLLALACLLLAAPAGASADSSFSTGSGVGRVTAQGEDLVYTVPSGGGERLRQGFGSAARNLPLRPTSGKSGSGFFGIDLGSDSNGRPALIYSRCQRGPNCDLFVYSFSSRKERKLKGVSRSACLERNPHLVRGTIVFVRDERRSRKPRLRCGGGTYLRRPGQSLSRITRSAPFEFDFDGTRLVYAQTTGTPDEFGGGDFKSQIRVMIPGRRSQMLAESRLTQDRPGDTGTTLSEPVLDGGRAYWVQADKDAAEGTAVFSIARRMADASGPKEVLERSGRLWVDNSPDRMDTELRSFAVTGNRLFYVYGVDRIGQVSGAPVFR